MRDNADLIHAAGLVLLGYVAYQYFGINGIILTAGLACCKKI